jgi:hypothetical protein
MGGRLSGPGPKDGSGLGGASSSSSYSRFEGLEIGGRLIGPGPKDEDEKEENEELGSDDPKSSPSP